LLALALGEDGNWERVPRLLTGYVAFLNDVVQNYLSDKLWCLFAPYCAGIFINANVCFNFFAKPLKGAYFSPPHISSTHSATIFTSLMFPFSNDCGNSHSYFRLDDVVVCVSLLWNIF
jgi:hypothetical protein